MLDQANVIYGLLVNWRFVASVWICYVRAWYWVSRFLYLFGTPHVCLSLAANHSIPIIGIWCNNSCIGGFYMRGF